MKAIDDNKFEETFNSFITQLDSLTKSVSELKAMTPLESQKIESNKSVIEEILPRLFSLEKEIALLKKDYDVLHEDYAKNKEESSKKFDDIFRSLNTIFEREKEIQGEINQVRMMLSKSEEEKNSRTSSIMNNLILPLLVAAVIAMCGFFIKACNKFDQQSVQLQRILEKRAARPMKIDDF